MPRDLNRREFMQGLTAAFTGACLYPTAASMAISTPTAPVSVAKCATYSAEVLSTLGAMFDQLGGLQRVVKGKTVGVKLNLTGRATDRVQGLPVEQTHWVHPQVVGATVHLLGKVGARRIRLLESTMAPGGSLEEFLLEAKWQPRDFASAASGVEFENTNFAGPGKKYSRLQVPGGGLLFRAYDTNHSYEDCDIFVSLAKLKEHSTAGVTLAMKNLFGIPPCTIYGEGAGIEDPSTEVKGPRAMLHDGSRQPSRSSLPENDSRTPRDPGYRVPRVTVDLVAARPIHLAVIDGIESMAGGEGPWVKHGRPVRPGLLIAGTNCVTTDVVATALMGFDPMADRGTAPFEDCDSTLRLAEQLGLGTRDLSRIEILGLPISKAKTSFRNA
jgi:uncharacterized protein (DUF362 family)